MNSVAKRQSGFTLVELMITVAIIAILSAIALPSYRDYVIRARLTDAFSALASAQTAAEQFWSNNRTYVGFNNANGFPIDTANFSYSLSNQTTSTYTITASATIQTPTTRLAGGLAKADPSVNGFAFTIDQNGNKTSVITLPGWTGSNTCWVNKKGAQCVQ